MAIFTLEHEAATMHDAGSSALLDIPIILIEWYSGLGSFSSVLALCLAVAGCILSSGLISPSQVAEIVCLGFGNCDYMLVENGKYCIM